MATQMKKSNFWLAIIFGTTLSFTFYQEVLTELFPIESLRLKVLSCASVISFVLICFYLLQFVVSTRFLPLQKSQKIGIILLRMKDKEVSLHPLVSLSAKVRGILAPQLSIPFQNFIFG